MLPEGLEIANNRNDSDFEPATFLSRLRDNLDRAKVLDQGWTITLLNRLELYIAEGPGVDDGLKATERCHLLENNVKLLFSCYRPDKEGRELYLYPDLAHLILDQLSIANSTETTPAFVDFYLVNYDEETGEPQDVRISLPSILFLAIGKGDSHSMSFSKPYVETSIRTILMGLNYGANYESAIMQKPSRKSIGPKRGWEKGGPDRIPLAVVKSRQSREERGSFFWNQEHFDVLIDWFTQTQQVDYVAIRQNLLNRFPELEDILGKSDDVLTPRNMGRLGNIMQLARKLHPEIVPPAKKQFSWEQLDPQVLDGILSELIAQAMSNSINPDANDQKLTIESLRRLVIANSGNKHLYEALNQIIERATGSQLSLGSTKTQLTKKQEGRISRIVHILAEKMDIAPELIHSQWVAREVPKRKSA